MKNMCVTYVGGGTDLMPLLKYGVRDDENLAFVRELGVSSAIEQAGDEIVIGAAATLWDVSQSELLQRELPAISQAAGETASPQIQNVATIGGNVMQDRRCLYFNQPLHWRSGLELCFKTGGCVCHQIPTSPVCRAIYYSDVATALLVYDAEVEFEEAGELRRTTVQALVERHTRQNGLACGEHLPVLLRRFILKRRPTGERSGFYKYAMRATIDFPLINFALRCGPEGSKLIAGAVSTQPVELVETARCINSGASNEEVIACCAGELKKLAKPIKEALISPANKRDMYRHIAFLLPLRQK